MFTFLKRKRKAPSLSGLGVPQGFIKVTRVYIKRNGTNTTIRTQPMTIQKSKIESYRPRNSIGTKRTGNRCVLVTTSGKYVNIKQKYSEVSKMLSE